MWLLLVKIPNCSQTKYMENGLNLSEDSLKSIERLLCLSVNGTHQLFDRQDIANILSTPSEELDLFNFDNVEKVQRLFLEFLDHKTFSEKKAFLKHLSYEEYEIVLRAYFHILDATMHSAQSYSH